MSVITRPKMTLDQFLVWEQEQEFRYEFDGENIIDVNGESLSHNLIVDNVYSLLRAQIDRSQHLVVTAGVKLIHDGKVRYPDVIVANALSDTSVYVIPEPVVVFEVMSPSSIRRDRHTKTLEYGARETIQHYILLRQDRISAQEWTRQDGGWVSQEHGAGAVLQLAAVQASIMLADCYEGVTPTPDKST